MSHLDIEESFPEGLDAQWFSILNSAAFVFLFGILILFTLAFVPQLMASQDEEIMEERVGLGHSSSGGSHSNGNSHSNSSNSSGGSHSNDSSAVAVARLLLSNNGWKALSRDVYRSPGHVNLFAAVLGNGAQLTILVSLILLSSLLGFFDKQTGFRGMYASVIIVYVCTTFISGLVSASVFQVCRNGSL